MIIQADARNIPLADGSVQCVVTSPPYWGLRDYGVTGQIGLEPTPEAYVATMVAVFREVRRVLRDDGTLWLNLGDSYSSGQRTSTTLQTVRNGNGDPSLMRRPPVCDSIKPKDLCGMPWRLAFALQADGWYLRSDIIWAKPNPMPESVTDRPTRSHEYLFLLAKSERYFYDADAIREDSIYKAADGYKDAPRGSFNGKGGDYAFRAIREQRNKRDVWTVNSEPTPEAHFATFPQRLIEPCILAGTSEKGCCPRCAEPLQRITERTAMVINRSSRTHELGRTRTSGTMIEPPTSTTIDWQTSCGHDIRFPVPCVVFDPFIGSGTVGKVCERLGRRWAGLELSGDYITIARKRTSQLGLFSGVAK